MTESPSRSSSPAWWTPGSDHRYSESSEPTALRRRSANRSHTQRRTFHTQQGERPLFAPRTPIVESGSNSAQTSHPIARQRLVELGGADPRRSAVLGRPVFEERHPLLEWVIEVWAHPYLAGQQTERTRPQFGLRTVRLHGFERTTCRSRDGRRYVVRAELQTPLDASSIQALRMLESMSSIASFTWPTRWPA